MNRFLKLVVMELYRIRILYGALVLFIFIAQFGGLLYHLNGWMSQVRRTMAAQMVDTYAEYLQNHGNQLSFGMAVSRSNLWFTGTVFIGIVALIGYVFFIWYRDWIGKNSFAYRLLMLPGYRMNLFWAKLTTIMLLVLGLVACQIALIPLQIGLFNQMIPAELAITETTFDFIRHHELFRILIPPTFLEFVLYYGAGLLAVASAFTAVLFERSFRLKGLVGGIAYAVAVGIAVVSPAITNYGTGFELYRIERFWLQFGIGAAALVLSLILSNYLLKRKITV